MSSTIDPGMSIPELINIVKQSFRESEFDEVQHILMDRVEKLKNENENLRRDHESAKKDARLLEEKLRISRKKCNELNDTISSLETRVGEMEKEREELKRQNVEAAKSLENLQTDHESRKKVARLLDKTQKLADLEKLRRSRQKCKELNDRISSFETRFGKMEKVEKEMEELKRQNDELRRVKIESDEKAERYKIRIDNLEPRIIRMEGALADMLNVKIEDLAPLANSIDKSDDDGAARGENVDIESDKVSQGLGNKNALETEPQRCHRTDGKGWQCKQGALPDQKYCESHYRRGRAKKLVLNTQSVNNFLPHLDKGDSSTKDNGANTSQTSPASQSGGSPRVEPQFPGDKNLVHSSTKDDGTNTAQISPGSQSGGSPSLEPVKVTGVQAGHIIEILDTDDETNSNDKFVSDTYLTKRNKRSRICLSDEEDDNIPVDGKENQDPKSTHDSITPLDGVRCGDSQTHDICTDSDDDSSCSDGHMNNLVATIRSKKMGTT